MKTPSLLSVALVAALGACTSANNTTTPTYTVGGHAGGLKGTLGLANNGSDTLSVTSGGSFTFAKAVPQGGSYAVTVTQQPDGQTCQVGNGSGTNVTANVTGVLVLCTTNAVQVSGSVVGASGPVTLVNGSQTATVTPPATTFAFTGLHLGDNYNVLIQDSPVSQRCTISGPASGTMPGTNVSGVTVTCVDVPTYALTGSVSGSSTDLVFEYSVNTQIRRSALAASATTFSLPGLHQGDSYSIKIYASSRGNTCTFNTPPASGTVGTSDVGGLDVTCMPNSYAVWGTLASSTSNSAIVVSDGTTSQSVTNVGDSFNFTGLADGSTVSLTASASGGASCTFSPLATFDIASANITGLQIFCP